MHERFSSSRIHGEWFRRTLQIQGWLDEIGAALPSYALEIKNEDDIVPTLTVQKKILLILAVGSALYFLAL